jgi:hypothetical protein
MMNNPVELPSLEEIAAIDQQRQKAIEHLEIIDGHVRCQSCGTLFRMNDNSSKTICKRIYQLQAMIKQIETHDLSGTSAKKEKQELADLLEENRKRDLVRRLPLYSSKITGYSWFCSKCYDECDQREREERKKQLLPEQIHVKQV